MRIITAQPSEYVAGLQLLFAHLPGGDAVTRLRGGLELLQAPGDPPARLIIARDGGAVAGAVLAQVLPGASGVLWPPCAAAGASTPERVEDVLLHEALAWLRRSGAKLAQVILAREDARLGVSLLRGGFVKPTELAYLQREPVAAPDAGGGRFETYVRAIPAVFHETLTRSYEGSLDFPEVDGRRSLREVLHGYQATGYDPARWWLRHDVDGPAGVLILSVLPGGAWDLSYVGVVPSARRRGHGRALVLKALAEAHAAGAGELTVCVDARNGPALALYRELGFAEFDRRDVFLKSDLAT